MIIDGKKEAEILREEVKKEIISIKNKTNRVPGLSVILIGDPAQLPPVRADALWIDSTSSKNAERRNGSLLYRSFTECLFLKENNRLDKNDP